MKNTKDTLLQQAVTVFGQMNQQDVAQEELAELIQEISKWKRGQGDPLRMAEEMADVMICLWQLRQMCGISQKQLRKAIKRKLERLEIKIERGER